MFEILYAEHPSDLTLRRVISINGGVKPDWNQNLILICEKCGKKLEKQANLSANPTHELKDWLKTQMREKEIWGTSRVATTSCLDLCPDGKIAVAFVSEHPELKTKIKEMDPVADREKILSTIIERAEIATKSSK